MIAWATALLVKPLGSTNSAAPLMLASIVPLFVRSTGPAPLGLSETLPLPCTTTPGSIAVAAGCTTVPLSEKLLKVVGVPEPPAATFG